MIEKRIMDSKNLIVDLSFSFALEIIEYTELLEEQRKYVIAKQLLKSGTSIGPNIREAQSAESRADFIHKFKIADKEVKEAEYWLLLFLKSEKYPNPDMNVMDKLKSINNIVSKIIITSKQKK